MAVFRKRKAFDCTKEQLFDWHERDGAVNRLTPPWEKAEIIEKQGGITDGSRMKMRVKTGPISQEWIAVHKDYKRPETFTDVMEKGPFKTWQHKHSFFDQGDGSAIEDDITYSLPLSPISEIVAGRWVEQKLEKMFAYRYRITETDMQFMNKYKYTKKLIIAVTGANGLIGSNLIPFLTTQGHEIRKIARVSGATDKKYYHNTSTGEIKGFEGADVVIHLAGEPIANARWTDSKKKEIMDSRAIGTAQVATAIGKLEQPPKLLITASAIGFYGDRGDEIIDEFSEGRGGFSYDVCVNWENAARPVMDKGVRVVFARTGVVLSPQSGALTNFLPFFKAFMGSVPGSGKQYLSWISIDDMIRGITHCIYTEELEGPVNFTAPEPVRMKELAVVLGKVLNRPSGFRIPSFIVKIMFGQMGKELLLAGAKVLPKQLLDTGFDFTHARLEPALRHMLGKAI
jgi:uncharacterized protein (TIGR01777 family)